MMSSTGNRPRFQLGIVAVVIIQGAGYVAALGWNLFLARGVSVELFGHFTFCYTIMTVLQLVIGMGCGQTIVRHLSSDNARKYGQGRTLRMAIVVPYLVFLALILLVWAVSPPSGDVFRHINAANLVHVLIASLSQSILVVGASYLQARRRPAVAVALNPALPSVLMLIAFVVMLHSSTPDIGDLLRAMAWLFAVPAFGVSAWLISIRDRGVGDREATGAPTVGKLLAFGSKAMLISLVYMGITNLDRLMLGFLTDPGELGLYGVAARFVGMIYLVVYLLPPLVGPIYAASLQNRTSIAKNAYEASTVIVTTVVLLMALVLVFDGRELLVLFAGERYGAASEILMVLTLSIFLVAATGNNGLMLQMGGRENIELIMSLGTFALNLVLNLVLIPRHGGLGAAYATAASLLVSTLVKTLVCHGIWGVRPALIVRPRLWLGAVAFVAVQLLWRSTTGESNLIRLILAVCVYLMLVPWRALMEAVSHLVSNLNNSAEVVQKS